MSFGSSGCRLRTKAPAYDRRGQLSAGEVTASWMGDVLDRRRFVSCSDCKISRRASRKPLCSSACNVTHNPKGGTVSKVSYATRGVVPIEDEGQSAEVEGTK